MQAKIFESTTSNDERKGSINMHTIIDVDQITNA